MKGFGILLAEWFITSLIIYAGLSGKQILFINGPRSAVITLGTIGFAMCMIMPTIGKFISNAPAHPLTIMGYFFGTIAFLFPVMKNIWVDVWPLAGDFFILTRWAMRSLAHSPHIQN